MYFGGGRRKEQRHADSPGRRLMPEELAEAAAAMGLPVSSNRYEPETTEGRNMQKSAIEEIKELKARMESITEQAMAEALAKANEAIGVLRELGLNNDTILKQLGFRGRAAAKESKSREESAPKDEPCPICHFRTDPPHDGRSHRGQPKKKPFTAEELEQKALTKV
jgi:hypothetical protein